MAEEQQELKAVLQGNREFTKNLYTVLAKKPGNIFFSPISIHAILSLSYQGTIGKTEEFFSKMLNVPNATVAAIGYREIMSDLNSIKDVTLLMANKVIFNKLYKLQEPFKTVAAQNFFAEVEALDFKKAEAAASSVNSWVRQKTNNKIKNIVIPNDFTENHNLVLVNAIYFKGKWSVPFNKQQTTIETFYLNDVDTVDVQMMHMKMKFFFKIDNNLNAKILELPYSNQNVSLIIILPKERNGIRELEKKLTEMDLMKVTEGMSLQTVEVGLPKFKIEQFMDLKDSLVELGLEIFSQNGEFPEMVTKKQILCVDKIIHKALIEVNEEGAEAAAVTVITKKVISKRVPRHHPEKFIADNPFLIMLITKEKSNGKDGLSQFNILFYGKISQPPSVNKEENNDKN